MKLLIVEDDPRVHGFLDRGLRAEGYRTELAEDGETGLQMARDMQKAFKEAGEKGVVILDLMLPKMSGLEVCQQLRLEGFALRVGKERITCSLYLASTKYR